MVHASAHPHARPRRAVAPIARPAPIHWTPLSGERARVVLRCTANVLGDSNQTLDIVTVEEITAQAQLRYLVDEGVFETSEGAALLAERPHLAEVDLERVRALPDGTLGREWVRFLDRHALDPGLTLQPTPYTSDDVAAYLLHRIRQAHDLWHVLLDVGTQGHEEVLVHAFSLAQTGLPSSVAIVALGALKHMVLEQRWSVLRHDVLRAHRRGIAAAPILAVFWERHLERPLAEVRDRYGVVPMTARDA